MKGAEINTLKLRILTAEEMQENMKYLPQSQRQPIFRLCGLALLDINVVQQVEINKMWRAIDFDIASRNFGEGAQYQFTRIYVFLYIPQSTDDLKLTQDIQLGPVDPSYLDLYDDIFRSFFPFIQQRDGHGDVLCLFCLLANLQRNLLQNHRLPQNEVIGFISSSP